MKLFLTSLMLAALVFFAPAANAAIEIGEPAPNFTITDTVGKPQSIEQHLGKTIVLEWTNAQCPYVKKHYGTNNMQKLQAYATDKDVVWLRIISSAPGKQGHVSRDEANRQSAILRTSETATILDEDGAIGKMYDAKTTPNMYVIDKEGKLIYAGAIDSNPSSDPETINGAQNYVKIVLDDIHAGRVISIDSTKPYGCSVKYAE